MTNLHYVKLINIHNQLFKGTKETVIKFGNYEGYDIFEKRRHDEGRMLSQNSGWIAECRANRAEKLEAADLQAVKALVRTITQSRKA